ncbi:MAG TPA: carbon storage regulator [Firmicutes bacterium]|nr:carbon storage regulator [Bacillota bacterium]
MLVVTRKPGESLIIGDDIEIKIIDLENGKIKIGIEAPKNIKIMRKEVIDEVKAQNEEALTLTTQDLMNILNAKK